MSNNVYMMRVRWVYDADEDDEVRVSGEKFVMRNDSDETVLQLSLSLLSFAVITCEWVCGLLSEIFDKVIDLTASFVLLGRALLALGSKINGGEPTHVIGLGYIVGGGVHLGDGDS